jgi:hypothetical protein
LLIEKNGSKIYRILTFFFIYILVVLPRTLVTILTEEEKERQREARTQGVHGASCPRVARRGSIPTRWWSENVQDARGSYLLFLEEVVWEKIFGHGIGGSCTLVPAKDTKRYYLHFFTKALS